MIVPNCNYSKCIFRGKMNILRTKKDGNDTVVLFVCPSCGSKQTKTIKGG